MEPQIIFTLADAAKWNWKNLKAQRNEMEAMWSQLRKVTGYPWSSIQTPEHKTFLNAYEGKYKDYPRLGSIVGYSAIKSLAAGIQKAGSVDSEKLVTAFRGLQVTTPFGKVTYRAEDHQSTMGAFVGRLKLEGGKGVMVNARYMDGARYLPSADEVKKLRPAD